MDPAMSTSASTVRTLHINMQCEPSSSTSLPSSPRSSALPSPPDSPSSDSVSSFPSVASSFFFSSAAASPPHPHSQSDRAHESTQGLIIPSLTLPDALRHPTTFGKTIGDLRLIVLSPKGTGDRFPTQLLLEDNDDILDVGSWEETEYGRVVHASTDWIEQHDQHGLHKFEPLRNVEVIEVPSYDQNDDAHGLIRTIQTIIQAPFQVVSEVLIPNREQSGLVASLLSSSSSPLVTALVFAAPLFPSSLEHLVLDELSTQIPIILLPPVHGRHHYHRSIPKLSSFKPSSVLALRAGLFRSPEILAAVRGEAADKYLHWSSVERSVYHIHSSRQREDNLTVTEHRNRGIDWRAPTWGHEWDINLSQDVAKRLRVDSDAHPCIDLPHNGPCFDPLHLPSLLLFSLSLLGPLQSRLRTIVKALCVWDTRVAVVGGICIGLGAGILLR